MMNTIKLLYSYRTFSFHWPSNPFNEANGTRVESTGNGNVQTRLGVRALIKGQNNIDDDKQRSFEPYIEANWIANTRNFGTTLNGVNVSQRGTKAQSRY